MATAKNTDHLKVAKDIYDLINKNDLEHMGELYARDAVHEVVALQETFKGRDGMIEFMREMKTAFPDARVTIESQVADKDTVVNEVVVRGTHRGPLRAPNGQTLSPTGRAVTIPLCEVMHFNQSGEVIRSREYWDAGSVLSQIGAI